MLNLKEIGQTAIVAILTGLSITSIVVPKSTLAKDTLPLESSQGCLTSREESVNNNARQPEILSTELDVIPLSNSSESLCEQFPDSESTVDVGVEPTKAPINRGNEGIDSMFFDE